MKDNIKHTVTSQAMAEQCYRDAMAMTKEFGYCVVEIKAGTRSLPQNALYWEWMTHIAEFVSQKGFRDENGEPFDKEDMHDRMRHDFLGYTEAKKIGSTTVGQSLRSTKKLTTGEMYHYMYQIDAYWASVGLLLPVPAESQYQKLKAKHEGGE